MSDSELTVFLAELLVVRNAGQLVNEILEDSDPANIFAQLVFFQKPAERYQRLIAITDFNEIRSARAVEVLSPEGLSEWYRGLLKRRLPNITSELADVRRRCGFKLNCT